MAMTDDELLTPKSGTNEELRQAILSRSLRSVRWRHRQRLAARGAVCAVCFLAGAATVWLRPAREPDVVTVFVREESSPVANAPGSPVEPRRLSPGELELEAEKTLVKADSARLFREAGDRYVNERADYQSALRCYRNFLDEASPEACTVSAEDTWLLTSLKRAREQETNP
jgi:hypothetical protein